MFIFLSKFLPLFVYPLGLVFILMIAAFVLQKKSPQWQRRILLGGILLIFLTGNSWVAIGLARSLEWRYLPPEEIPQVDAIVVLGGGTASYLYPRPIVEMNGAGDRMVYGAWLYHQGSAPLVLLSGGSITWLDGREISAAEEMAQILAMLGVPDEVILLQTQSRNTYEDALYSCEILKEKGIKRILLVTSAMHMPRSVALFEHQGMEVIPAPTDYTVTQDGWDSIFSFNPQAQLMAIVPNIGNVGLTTSVFKEYLGMLVYTLRGWM